MAVRRIFIATFAILAVIALAAGWFLVRQPGWRPSVVSPLTTGTPTPVPTPQIEPEDVKLCEKISDAKQLEQCRAGGYYMFSRELLTAAMRSGKPEHCENLPDSALRDQCRFMYALELKDAAFCGRIEGETVRQDCSTLFIARGDDFLACDQVTDLREREYCQKQVLMRVAGDGPAACDRYDSKHRANCVELYWTMQAIGSADYGPCKKIPDRSAVQRCLARLPPDTDGDQLSDQSERRKYFTDPKKPDTDGDGLNDYDELKIYFTLPLVVDTDGDGYTDGQEVLSGYDPKGTGKLIK